MFSTKRCLLVLVLAILAYLVAYPDDTEALVRPFRIVLGLTTSISPSFYGVIAVGIIAYAMIKIWGPRTAS